jgi:hydrogenase-4 component B
MRLAIFAAPVLALVGGLALACFAKVTGVVFLGTPRSARVAEASEVGSSYLIPQGVLAAACFAIGLLPALLATAIARVGAFVAGEPAWSSVGAAASIGTLRGPMLFAIALTAAITVAALLRFALMRRRSIRHAPTWGCGYPEPTPRMQYTASSFASPLVSMFGAVSGVHEHRGATIFHSEPSDLVLDGVLVRAWARVEAAALRLRPIQQGRLHLYLVYVVAAVLSCLVYFVVAR